MTDETFTDRQKNISETLQEKYGLTQEQVDGLISGELTEEDFEDEKYNLKGTNKQTNLITNLINIEKARKNFNDATGTTDKIVDIKTDTKDQKSGGDGGDGWSGADWGDNPGGEFDTTSSNAGTSEGWSNADWGPDTGEFNQGGRVGLRYGGLLSIL